MQEVPFRRQAREPAAAAAAVHVIANHRMTDRREMDADLMRSPRVQVRAQEVTTAKSRKPKKICPRCLSRIDDRHTLSVSRMSRDGLIHGQRVGIEVAPSHGRILTRDPARGNRSAQAPVSDIVLGHDEETGRLLIEPVDYAGSVRAASLRQVTTAAHQSVDECPRPIAGRRMDHHPRGLVHHEKIIVLMHDGHGHRLPDHFAAFGLWHSHLDDVSGNGAVRRLFLRAVHGDVPSSHKGRGPGSGTAQPRGYNQIEPVAGNIAG